MDVRFLSSERSEGFSSLKGELDEKLLSILGRLSRGNFGQSAKEVLANFTKAALLSARKKVFSNIVAKEEEKQTIATSKKNATRNDADERAALPDHPPSTWRMINRRSKPKIADDLLLLVLYVKSPGESFPVQILKKPSERSNNRDANEDPDDFSDTAEDDDWTRDIPDSENERQSNANESAAPKKRNNESSIERFIIREPRPVEPNVETSEQPEIEVTKLCDTHTTTRDLIETRTIATQTIPCVVSYPAGDDSVYEGNTCQTKEPSGIGETEGSKESSSGKPRGRSRSVNSLLDYIDGEYNSLAGKEGGIDKMEPNPRRGATPSACDSRFRILEGKYEEVAKRVTRLERLHEREPKTMCDKTNPGRYDHRYEHSGHNATGVVAGPSMQGQLRSTNEFPTNEPLIDLASEPNMQSGRCDERSWDPDLCDTFVRTQDSQGNQVTTRATPVHLHEISSAKGKLTIPRQSTVGPRVPNAIGTITTSDVRTKNPRHVLDQRSDAAEDTRDVETHSKNMQRHFVTLAVMKPPNGANVIEHPTLNPDADIEDNRNHGMSKWPRADDITSQGECSCKVQSSTKRSSDTTNTANIVRQPEIPSNQPPKPTAMDGRQPSKLRPAPSADADPDTDTKRRRLNAVKQHGLPSTSSAAGCSRPTEYPYGNHTSGKSTNDSASDSEAIGPDGKKSYARVVTEQGWTIVAGNQSNGKGPKHDFPPIKSAAPSRNKELYVRGMSCANFKLHRDLEEAVKWYCRERDIVTIHQRVIMYNKDSDSVGIKVVVKEQDVEKFMSKGFWPDGISVREWSEGKPTARERFFDNGRSSSDESL